VILGWLAGAVCLMPGAACAAAPVARLTAVRVNSQECYDLARWGRAQALRMTVNRESREVRLTNRYTRLDLALGSRLATINGVKAWLSVPLAARDNDVFVSVLDVRTTFEPVLQPVRLKAGRKVRTVVLDPGHGGRDPGYRVGDREEKTHTLLLALRLKTLLSEAGFKVVLTRSGDTTVDLNERAAIARRARGDVLLSLHYNAAAPGNKDAKGVEVYCITPAGAVSTNVDPSEPGSTRAVPGNQANSRSALLAYQVQKAMVRSLPVEDRGLRRARFQVLRSTEIPAVLIEGGFMSCPDEAKRIFNINQRTELARAIVDGVLAYKRLVERK